MTDRIEIRLHEPAQAHKAIMHAWGNAKDWLMAGHRLVLTIKPEPRTSPQNRLLHATIADIARQAQWAGAKRAELTEFVMAWAVEHGVELTAPGWMLEGSQ